MKIHENSIRREYVYMHLLYQLVKFEDVCSGLKNAMLTLEMRENHHEGKLMRAREHLVPDQVTWGAELHHVMPNGEVAHEASHLRGICSFVKTAGNGSRPAGEKRVDLELGWCPMNFVSW